MSVQSSSGKTSRGCPSIMYQPKCLPQETSVLWGASRLVSRITETVTPPSGGRVFLYPCSAIYSLYLS